MGSATSNLYWDQNIPEHIPRQDFKPGFDPQLGFKTPRKPRVSHMSEQEMMAMKLRPEERDYCAHHLKDYLVCMRMYTPFNGLCTPEATALKHCGIEDYELRMKEYEREKRLRMREMRKEGKVIQ